VGGGVTPWILIDRIGDLVPTLGTHEFSTQFFDLFSGALDVDECTVFAFRGRTPPSAVIMEGRSVEMRQRATRLADAYVAGAFERDPNVPKGVVPETPVVRIVSADDFEDPAYRLQFYDEPNLSHELVVIGQTKDTLYYSSFYRRDRKAVFHKAEIDVANRLARAAIQLIHKHRDAVGSVVIGAPTPPPGAVDVTVDNRAQLLAHLRDVLLNEPQRLSPREAEVCAGIILGYTTLGISLNFGISLNTVATHRKRAYRKLGICSQNELFSRYFRVVNSQLAGSATAA
jgi:DNA-binding CsgD family transcriptional regulator